jgi:hypothetical protein
MDWEFIWGIVPITIFWRIAANEVARWMRARQRGLRGANEAAGFAVDIIGGISYFAYYPWLLLAGFKLGWPETIAIAAITFLVGMVLNMFIAGDKIALWIASLLVSPVMMIYAYITIF